MSKAVSSVLASITMQRAQEQWTAYAVTCRFREVMECRFRYQHEAKNSKLYESTRINHTMETVFVTSVRGGAARLRDQLVKLKPDHVKDVLVGLGLMYSDRDYMDLVLVPDLSDTEDITILDALGNAQLFPCIRMFKHVLTDVVVDVVETCVYDYNNYKLELRDE